MLKVLKFLLTGITTVGIPLMANQFRSVQEAAPKTTLAILLASFITKKRKELIHTALIAIFGTVLMACGISFVLFTVALKTDLSSGQNFQTSFIVSSAIFLLGAILDIYVWRKSVNIEREFETIAREQLSPGTPSGSFFKHLLANIIKIVSDRKSYQHS